MEYRRYSSGTKGVAVTLEQNLGEVCLVSYGDMMQHVGALIIIDVHISAPIKHEVEQFGAAEVKQRSTFMFVLGIDIAAGIEKGCCAVEAISPARAMQRRESKYQARSKIRTTTGSSRARLTGSLPPHKSCERRARQTARTRTTSASAITCPWPSCIFLFPSTQTAIS